MRPQRWNISVCTAVRICINSGAVATQTGRCIGARDRDSQNHKQGRSNSGCVPRVAWMHVWFEHTWSVCWTEDADNLEDEGRQNKGNSTHCDHRPGAPYAPAHATPVPDLDAVGVQQAGTIWNMVCRCEINVALSQINSVAKFSVPAGQSDGPAEIGSMVLCTTCAGFRFKKKP